MATQTASLPAFDNTLGALFIGFAVSAVAYGMLTIQMYTYYSRYPFDKASYKILVTLPRLMETTHQVLLGHVVYYYTVTNFTDVMELLRKPIWYVRFALHSTETDICFSLRVWRFSYGNWWLTSLLVSPTVRVNLLTADRAYHCFSFELSGLPDLVDLRVLGSTSLALGVLNDLAVAAALCYYLQSIRSSYTKDDSTIRTLTIYAVNTGILTSAMSFATVIVYDLMPKNLIFVGCYFVVSKLYAISFLATLNTRQIIRGRGTDRETAKPLSFQIVTEGGPHTINIPLQMPTPTIDDSGDIEGRQKACPLSSPLPSILTCSIL
ncbi:hypothetical protein PAXRUDRAFT_133485 [Paxillus rubicundulus Ve08.2h10]|uniref:DUF6534 domain-containing protein n=1 Tax=Paxillus rubicundulus Ve08.2h10 TaxID=930991 RepID=A0A0D0DJV7_9AGAM|nr:hypothetical protein PAXRUDRAFT_133485 [Paxillus rubicundulus Ve08.2h10]